jgi:microcystin-dependent protein
MSSIQLQGNSSGTGVMTVSSPNTNTNYTITLPQSNTTLVGTDSTQTLSNKTFGAGNASFISTVSDNFTISTYTNTPNPNFHINIGDGAGGISKNPIYWNGYLAFSGNGRADSSSDFLIGPNGQIGLSGANYGTSGQVLTSAGSGSAPTWSTLGGSPIGTVIYFAASTAPTGYLKANGAVISRTTYSSLFAVIGTTFGVGDNSTTFGLPDLRGEFLRGWDDGRGIDSGRAFGTFQDYLVQSHIHSMWNAMSRDSTQGDPNATSAGTFAGGGGQFYAHPNTDTYGGTETRPRNIDLLACIKYI